MNKLFAEYVLKPGEEERSVVIGSGDSQVKLLVGDFSPPFSHLQMHSQTMMNIVCSIPSRSVLISSICFLTWCDTNGEENTFFSRVFSKAENLVENDVDQLQEPNPEINITSDDHLGTKRNSPPDSVIDLHHRLPQNSKPAQQISKEDSHSSFRSESTDGPHSQTSNLQLNHREARDYGWNVEEGEWRGDSYVSFLDWSAENKKWVEFGVEFGLKKTVMDKLLQNFDAPYMF
ncbi:hypothetical protein FGB62_29g219 [Gracilaria domingensis]|nr:hypothetical protein FGB62_29g219 [Gracilaria domingensis]